MKVTELWLSRVGRVQAHILAAILLFLASSSGAAPLQLLSARNPALAPPSGGDGYSASPILSRDGRFVLFSSSANDLVPGGNSQFTMNLYLRDRASNTTVLVSANMNGTGAANGNSTGGIISTNGRWALFESEATDLVPNDTNGLSDIFVRDLQTGSNILVNVATNGGPANGRCYDAAMTPDGRYVVFYSEASNLIANDTNGVTDVLVRDLVSQTTTLVSVGAVKSSLTTTTAYIIPTGPPAITPDGRFVAFFSAAHGMASNVTSAGEIYLRDLVANTTTWASSNSLVGQVGLGNFLNYHPRISDDGRFVAFKFSFYDGSKSGVILQYDSSLNSLLLIASNALPQMFNDDVYGPEMTPDGRFIAYVSGTPTNQPPLRSSVYLADTQAGTNVLVSVLQDGTTSTNSDSDSPVLSPDGRFVAFVSNATNLVSNTISNGCHIYLRDVLAGVTTLVDAGTNGVAVSDEYGNAPGLSSDGKRVAFASPDGNLLANGRNQTADVFVRDLTGGTNELISQRDATILPATSRGLSSAAQLSLTPNGRWVVFSSSAEDLVANDFNGAQDVFVRDLQLGTISLVSADLDGNSAAGFSATPVISSNGQFVAFYSMATNLVANATNTWGGIFLRDLVAGTNTLVSVSATGAAANGPSASPAMSQDGRYVAFLSTAYNLVLPTTGTGRTNTFWRDTVSGVTIAVTTNGGGAFPPSISANGRYVAYSTNNTVAIWDSQTLTNIYVATSPSPVLSAAISPDGMELLYQGNNTQKVYSVALNSNVFSMFGSVSIRSPAQWSADGRFVTFVARSNVASGPFTNNQVFLGDMIAGTLALVSCLPDHSTAGNGPSDNPSLSGNGRDIVYRSDATDIAPGAVPGSSLIVYDRATGSNTVINIGGSGSDWVTRVSRPMLDAAGQTVTFQSTQSGLVPNDLNRGPDIFAGQPAIIADSDGDGIPDWWLLKYFGHATGLAGDHSRAQDDADGDGFSNLQEFLAGTDPLNNQSLLQVNISAPSGAGTATLNWPSVAGKTYQVQYKANLRDSVWSSFGAPIVSTSSIVITVPLTSASGFYRVIDVN